MKDNGKGGMQSAGAQFTLICPKCGKPAFRREVRQGGTAYLHFTKKGSVRHFLETRGDKPC